MCGNTTIGRIIGRRSQPVQGTSQRPSWANRTANWFKRPFPRPNEIFTRIGSRIRRFFYGNPVPLPPTRPISPAAVQPNHPNVLKYVGIRKHRGRRIPHLLKPHPELPMYSSKLSASKLWRRRMLHSNELRTSSLIDPSGSSRGPNPTVMLPTYSNYDTSLTRSIRNGVAGNIPDSIVPAFQAPRSSNEAVFPFVNDFKQRIAQTSGSARLPTVMQHPGSSTSRLRESLVKGKAEKKYGENLGTGISSNGDKKNNTTVQTLKRMKRANVLYTSDLNLCNIQKLSCLRTLHFDNYKLGYKVSEHATGKCNFGKEWKSSQLSECLQQQFRLARLLSA